MKGRKQKENNVEDLSVERIERMEFLLERIKDKKRFYIEGNCYYFSMVGILIKITDKISGRELINGKYKNIYETEICETSLNRLLDLYTSLSLEKYETKNMLWNGVKE